MKRFYSILAGMISLTTLHAQPPVEGPQTKSILLLNATAHIGNGTVIERSAIGFKNGKLSLVSDVSNLSANDKSYDIIIDVAGKHVYPGLIAPNSTLGLAEIDAVKASIDENELGQMNPNVKSIYAYNADSRIIETVRSNGVLMAQITPRGGRISGSSSIVQLDAWNWQDALVKEDVGIHVNLPESFTYSRNGQIEIDKNYLKNLQEISAYLSSAKAYQITPSTTRNLLLEAARGLFDGTKTLFLHSEYEKQMIDGVEMALSQGIKKIVIVGGYEAHKITGFLKKNQVGVLLRRVHSLPLLEEDDVDLPFRLAKMLTDKGITVGLENAGDMERMNTRNLPFLAGTCAAYGLDREQALMLVTSNTAKLLGINSFCGTLETGKDATLFVSEGDALDMRSNQLTHAFIQGRKVNLESHQTRMNDRYKTKYNQK